MAASPKKVKRTLHYRKRNYGKNNDDSAPSSSMFSSLSPNALRFAHVFLVLLVIMTTLRSGLYNSSRRGFVDIDEAHVNVPLLSHWWSKIGNTQQQEGIAHPISKLRSSPSHSSSRSFPIIDIITVGSMAETELLQAQKETFGSHPSVRNFVVFDESDDSEANCHTNLTIKDRDFVAHFCHTKPPTYGHIELYHSRNRFASKNFLQTKGLGWLCAQKRPAESLAKYLGQYQTNQYNGTATATTKISLPDYLVLIDADTYLNLDNMLGQISTNEKDENNNYHSGFLTTEYPSSDTLVVAGCRIRERIQEHNFTFPWGGFGTFYTKRSLERYVRPIYCPNSETTTNNDSLLDSVTGESLKLIVHRELTDSEHTRLVCSKLQEDNMNEKFLFRNGMSVSDLMYAYVTHWNYVGASDRTTGWSVKNGGFCLHADWVIGYFVNHYYLSNRYIESEMFKDNPETRLLGYNGSEHYAGKQYPETIKMRRECNNDYDENCDPSTAHICHHVKASKMREYTNSKASTASVEEDDPIAKMKAKLRVEAMTRYNKAQEEKQ